MKVQIGNKKYSTDLVELLTGAKGATEVNDEWLPVLDALQEPQNFPFLVEKIYYLEPTEPLRLALARCQIDAELRMRENLEQHQRRLYIAQTVEKILYGDLLVEGISKDKDKDGDDEEKEKRGKKEKKN